MNRTLYICKYISFHDVPQFKVRTVLQVVTTFRYTNFLLTQHVLATIHWFFANNATSDVKFIQYGGDMIGLSMMLLLEGK